MAKLYPGAPRWTGERFVLDDLALQNSMAKAMDDAMADVFQKLKGIPMPDHGKEDRRLLMVAIARGILIYLEQNQNSIINSLQVSVGGGTPFTESVTALDLNVSFDSP